VDFAIAKISHVSRSQQISLIQDGFLGICSSSRKAPPPFPLTEPLSILANKVFEICKKDCKHEFVIEQLYYLVTLLDLPEEVDSSDVINEVAFMFLHFLGREQGLRIDCDDVLLSGESVCSFPPENIDNQLSLSHRSPPRSIYNHLRPPTNVSQISPVCLSSPGIQLNPACSPPSREGDVPAAQSCPSPTIYADSQVIQSCPSPSGNVRSTEATAPSPSQDLFPDFQLSGTTETWPAGSLLTPSQSRVSISSSTPLLIPASEVHSEPVHATSLLTPSQSRVSISSPTPLPVPVSDAPSEPDSDNSGPATRQCLVRKFVKKMATKEAYFLKFCKAVATTCGASHSKDTIIQQCTLLISKNCLTTISIVKNNFGIQGVIQRIVPKVASILAENKKTPFT